MVKTIANTRDNQSAASNLFRNMCPFNASTPRAGGGALSLESAMVMRWTRYDNAR